MVRKDGKERDGAEKEEKRRRLKEKHKWNEENGGTRKEKKREGLLILPQGAISHLHN